MSPLLGVNLIAVDITVARVAALDVGVRTRDRSRGDSHGLVGGCVRNPRRFVQVVSSEVRHMAPILQIIIKPARSTRRRNNARRGLVGHRSSCGLTFACVITATTSDGPLVGSSRAA